MHSSFWIEGTTCVAKASLLGHAFPLAADKGMMSGRPFFLVSDADSERLLSNSDQLNHLVARYPSFISIPIGGVPRGHW